MRPVTLVLMSWLGAGLAGHAAQPAAPQARLDPARFEAEIAAFEADDRASPPAAGATLFVGSSSIRYWDVAAAFPTLRTIRRGYGGSHVSDTIRFADRLIVRYRPALVRLNLNARGYEAWTAATRPTVERLAARRAP